MRISNLSHPRFLLLLFCSLFISAAARSQTPSASSRIVERVNESALTPLMGNTHPLAQARFDQGVAPPDLPMERMLLVLKRSDAQEAALDALLDAQQDPNSASYHQWLTPDAFGQQYGPGDQDIQAVAAWLVSHGFQIGGISRGRTVIEFSGTAAQVQQAFHTEIHKYVVNGETHWANASDPQIPQALAPVIVGINSLHNFAKKPAHRIGGVYSKSRLTGEVKSLRPGFTYPGGTNLCGPTSICYFVGPYDFAKIYNVLPLWNASPAIDGTGQSIAILGRSDIVLQDVRDFRALFNLPKNDPNFIVNGVDPGIVSGDETEAVLDVEWSGAVAKGATIHLVISSSTETTDGVDLSAVYAVENNVAPIVNESFLQCELFLGAAGNSFENAIREQAAAQGITFFTSAGDQGSAGCDNSASNPPAPATYGLMVNGLATSPYGVAVGGTDFLNSGPNYTINSLQAASPYWRATNDANLASALGYIPESSWNSTCTNNIFVVLGLGSSPEVSCNNARLSSLVDTDGGSGGKSNCINPTGSLPSSCTGGYAKPSWQVAPGVPADGARDIPDVSLFASNGFMGSAYVICEADQTQSQSPCGLTSYQYDFLTIGGTSASSPSFAGIMAMVNQYTQSAGQGNANHVLYKLASSTAQRSANCSSSTNPASTCIFNDVTSGTIATPCAAASPNCTLAVPADTYGILSGYSAGTGYDLATGLGSVNAYNLIHNWSAPGIATATSLSLNSGKTVSITHGQQVPFAISVLPSAATGEVSLIGSPTTGTSVAMGSFLTLQNGAVSGTTSSLAGGTSYQLKAHYAGDSVYAPSDSTPITVTVAPEPSTTLISIPVFDTTGNETGDTPSSLVYGSQYIARVDVGNAKAAVTFPMRPVCSQLNCPTGSVTLTDSFNGGPQTPLGTTGVYPLNGEGFAEDQSVQLSGGTHQFSASYTGDASYNPSSGNYKLVVSPAPTTTLAGNPPLPPNIVTPFGLGAIIQTNSPGVMPSCNVTFYDGNTPVPGTVTCSGQNGGPTWGAFLQPSLQITTTTRGIHTYTAKFNGDSNYSASTGPALTTNVSYGTIISLTVDNSIVQYGSNITLTAIVDTFQPQSPPISNQVSFYEGENQVSGTVVYTAIKDASGNVAMQASLTIAPQSSSWFNAIFPGDANYGGAGSSEVFVTVNIPDFTVGVNPTSLTITAGQSATAVVTVTPASSSTGPVTLSCSPYSLPAGAQCSFSPPVVTLSGGNSATSTLTMTTLQPSSTNTVALGLPKFHKSPSFLSGGRILGAFLCLICFLFISISRGLRRHPLRLAFTSACILGFVISCGTGGSGSGNNGTGGNGGGTVNQVSTSISLTTSAVKAPPTAVPTIQAKISSSEPVTGTVTFYDQGTILNVVTVLSDGTAVLPGFSPYPGTHVFTASYSGDTKNLPSTTTAPLDQAITGTIYTGVAGTTGSLMRSATVPITIQ
ncbi:MAG TPA: Ig-like domain repeat protein [Candidatus Saccharimonadales bacterium]|jgi:hypothetical protein|nr:Ig-like domain repeat protein [Candidatus Saccharimonadales bacterium]